MTVRMPLDLYERLAADARKVKGIRMNRDAYGDQRRTACAAARP